MIVTELENNLIEDLFLFAPKEIMTSANLDILKSGKQNKLVEALDDIDINKLVYLKSRDEYDC